MGYSDASSKSRSIPAFLPPPWACFFFLQIWNTWLDSWNQMQFETVMQSFIAVVISANNEILFPDSASSQVRDPKEEAAVADEDDRSSEVRILSTKKWWTAPQVLICMKHDTSLYTIIIVNSSVLSHLGNAARNEGSILISVSWCNVGGCNFSTTVRLFVSLTFYCPR